MLAYIVRRILFFIPTLLVISLGAFFLSVLAPGDPVSRAMNENFSGLRTHPLQMQRLIQAERHELGLDLPLFYFSAGTLADPDLKEISNPAERQKLVRLARKNGNTALVMAYYRSLKDLEKKFLELSASQTGYDRDMEEIQQQVRDILSPVQDEDTTLLFLGKMIASSPKFQALAPDEKNCRENYHRLENEPQKWRIYIPLLQFHGTHNQYHRWLSGILKGDFGISYRTRQPVLERIWQKLPWSFSLTLLALIFSFAVSIPVGVLTAKKQNSFCDRASAGMLFILFALPSFFVGALLLILFANPDFLHWFPESGVLDPLVYNPDWPLAKKILHWAPYLVLPLITYSYAAFAFLSRELRSSMLDVLRQDFITTARAKGLPEKKVIWKHAFRNSLLPLITILSQTIPLAVAGSLIVETLFSIPGMGLEIVQSVLAADYPMIVGIFTIFGLFTVTAYLLADFLYALADPRISYG